MLPPLTLIISPHANSPAAPLQKSLDFNATTLCVGMFPSKMLRSHCFYAWYCRFLYAQQANSFVGCPVGKTLSSSANRLRYFLLAPVLAGMQANDRKYSSRLNQMERSIAEIERSLNEVEQAILTSAMERLYPPKHKIIAGAEVLVDIPNEV